MRVTMQSIYSNILLNLNKLNTDINRVNQQISSGKQMSSISDNPVNLVNALGLRTNLSEIGQYQKNLNYGNTVITASENALVHTKDLVMRAKTLAIQQANAPMTPENRQNAAMEIKNLWEQAIILANSSVNGKYIFGGFRTTGYTPAEPAPFVQGARDGYFVNGSTPTLPSTPLNGELLINGRPVFSQADGLSTIYADASAAAKAAAINNGDYGVQAEITPAGFTAAGPVQAGSLGPGDLVINGIEILVDPVSDLDSDNALVRAINARQADTGVVASRDQDGKLILSAQDGRNLQVATSAMGEQVTQLNNLDWQPADQVHFGSVRLWSAQTFSLESRSDDDPAAGLAALGLTADGDDPTRLLVNTIHRDNDYVRYAGDRDNDISIKMGQQSTIAISKNGYDAIMDTGVFRVLKELEDFLLGEKFTTATGAAQATNVHATLNSGDTGLGLADRIVEGGGEFKVTIANHDSSPPTRTSTTIRIDPANDTLDDIAQRLNGIPGLQAAWTDDGHLRLDSTDPERYSFDLSEDTSGLLDAVGLRFDQIQASALQKSIADLDLLLNEQTNQISDFGARANRIEVQTNIYMNLELATAENLSELEDTDLVKALMDMQAKEVAYQAALNVAAKTMRLSLVDFL